MESFRPKPKIAIVSLTCCEGCEFALLDLGQRFLDLINKAEMVDFRMAEDEKDPGGMIDVGIAEGSPITNENIKTLKKLRERSKILAVLGNCAAMGGVHEVKNYQEGKNTIKRVYQYVQGIDNPEIKEADNFVKVDFTFPGCPINGEEFLKYMPELLKGNIPAIKDLPVCTEGQARGNRCLLL